MMSKKKIGLIFVAVAVAIAIHHYLVNGKLFDVEQLHHEQFIVSFLCVGLAFMVVT